MLLTEKIIPAYRQRPGDEGQLTMDAEQDHEEEDGGEDPQSDGHKHHPSVCWYVCVSCTGYQRPVEQTQNLKTNKTMWAK